MFPLNKKLALALMAIFSLHEVLADKLVYSGAFLPVDDGTGALMFADKNLDDYEVLSTVWDPALTYGGDSPTSAGYVASPYFETRSAGELTVQLQHWNRFDSRCVKIVLRQNGSDIYGAVVYARSTTSSCMVAEDWDTFKADSYKIHVEPEAGKADSRYGLGINQLTLAMRVEVGDVVTEVKSDSVISIAEGAALTTDRVTSFDVPGFQIADAGLLNVSLKPSDNWTNQNTVFDRPLAGLGGRLRFTVGARGTRPDCADGTLVVNSSTNKGYLGWSYADRKLVAKYTPLCEVAGIDGILYYRPSSGAQAIDMQDVRIIKDSSSDRWQVRGYDATYKTNRFVRVYLTANNNDLCAHIDKIGSWAGTLDDDLDMDKFGVMGISNSEVAGGIGMRDTVVLRQADTHLGWSQADRHLVAPRVTAASVTNLTGTVYKRTGGVTKKTIGCKTFSFTRSGTKIEANLRGVDSEDETHIYAVKVFLEEFDGSLYGWITRIGDYTGTIDDDSPCSNYTSAGISNMETQNGQGVCDFRPVCEMGTATTAVTVTGGNAAGANGTWEVRGMDTSVLKATVKDVTTFPTNGVVSVWTNAELIVDGGKAIGENKGPLVPAKTVNVYRGGTLRVVGDYELPASTAVYLYGGEYNIGYGRNVNGDAYQHAYYVYMANGARIYGARPRVANWQRSYWRSAGTTPSTVDCSVNLCPGSATNNGFSLDVYDTGNGDAADMNFNGAMYHYSSKSPRDGGPGCPIVKRCPGTVSFNGAGGNFLDWFPVQIEQGVVRFGVSGVVTSAVNGASIQMQGATKIIAAANTVNSANALNIALNDKGNGEATLVLEEGASLTFTDLAFEADGTSLTVIGDLSVNALRFTSVLTADQLARIRARDTAEGRRRGIVQTSDGYLRVAGTQFIVR